jgi:hypothetical protein
VEIVDDPRSLVDAVAGLDQGVDPGIIELGPSADHVNDVDVRGVKMETCAAFCLRALICHAHQLHPNLAFGGGIDPGVT